LVSTFGSEKKTKKQKNKKTSEKKREKLETAFSLE